MNKKRLPQIGDICYITFKVSETETTEELGYLGISQVEDEVEDGFIDEDGNCFEYFFHIPAIDKHFEINQLVSWRDINSWLTGRPERDGTYLVVLDDYTVTTLDYDNWEGEWDGISNDGVLYWQEFPKPPKESKSE